MYKIMMCWCICEYLHNNVFLCVRVRVRVRVRVCVSRLNYKDYSMESRLHFRIHAALSSLKSSPVGTP